MKYLFFALVLVILFSGCMLSSYIVAEYDIEIIGTSQAHLIINNIDYGFVQLPYIKHIIHDNQGYNAIKSIQIWSTEVVTFNLYKDSILIYNASSTFIDY